MSGGTTCPHCQGTKRPEYYLCPGCWYRLSPAARRALNHRGPQATLRLLQLHRQLADDVPLDEIQITT